MYFSAVEDDILQTTDNGKITAVVLLDYSRGFDTIKHDIVEAVLGYVGLGKDSMLLFCNYLLNRYQRA